MQRLGSMNKSILLIVSLVLMIGVGRSSFDFDETEIETEENLWSFDFDESELETEEKLWKLYARWRSHYNITRSINERCERFKVFTDNARHINKFNKEKHSYKLELNLFGDMSDEEFQKYHHGIDPIPSQSPGHIAFNSKPGWKKTLEFLGLML